MRDLGNLDGFLTLASPNTEARNRLVADIRAAAEAGELTVQDGLVGAIFTADELASDYGIEPHGEKRGGSGLRGSKGGAPIRKVTVQGDSVVVIVTTEDPTES